MNEAREVLYMGDDSLQGAAAYLGGVLTHAGVDFSYVPSTRAAPLELLKRSHGLIIVSDYPAKRLESEAQAGIVASVERGASLMMIGGWESFHGLAGEYHEGLMSKILPVKCKACDDRVNYCQGVVPWIVKEHPCLEGLPWHEPPIFCGFNETSLADDAELVLSARLLQIREESLSFADKDYPLLAFGSFGEGKTAALTTDLAPHWVGGWVDWGTKRISARAEGGNEVEVGQWYAQFISQLVGFLIS